MQLNSNHVSSCTQQLLLDMKPTDEMLSVNGGWISQKAYVSTTSEDPVCFPQPILHGLQGFQAISDGDERSIFRVMKAHLQNLKGYQQESLLVLNFLDTFVMHAAHEDPSTLLMPGAVLPMLRQKVGAWALSEGQKMQAVADQEVCVCRVR